MIFAAGMSDRRDDASEQIPKQYYCATSTLTDASHAEGACP